MLWLLALDRLAGLEDWTLLPDFVSLPFPVPDFSEFEPFLELDPDPLRASLFLKWLLTWRSSSVCNFTKKRIVKNFHILKNSWNQTWKSNFTKFFPYYYLPECQNDVYIHPLCIGMAYCLHGSWHVFPTKVWMRNLYRRLCSLPINICTVGCLFLLLCCQSHLFGFLPRHEQSGKSKQTVDFTKKKFSTFFHSIFLF